MRVWFEFQRLEVYKKAKLFHLGIKGLLLAHSFDRYVNDQLGRASFSVILNISEGSGKFSKADRKNYFTTARASVFECASALDVLHDEGSLKVEEVDPIMAQADELSRMLYKMIQNLK